MPTRWGDADAIGHINNAMFMRYLESARLDYYSELLDLPVNRPTRQSTILAGIQIDFLGQVIHPTDLVVGTRISRLGNSSFDVDGVIFRVEEESPVVVSKAFCVWFNYDENRSQPVPQAVREAVINYEKVKPL